MNPAQMIRALGQAAKLAGRGDLHAELCELEDGATLHDVLSLLGELEEGAAAHLPEAERHARELERPGRGGGEAARRADEVLALAAEGLSDPQIAERLGLTASAVRGVRRRAKVAGHPKPRARSGWQDKVRDAHTRGLTVPEIAAETGYSVGTVREYLYRLGLRAHRLPGEPDAEG